MQWRNVKWIVVKKKTANTKKESNREQSKKKICYSFDAHVLVNACFIPLGVGLSLSPYVAKVNL
jgi:hypothetical protein